MIYRKLFLPALIAVCALLFTPGLSQAQLVYSHFFEWPGLYGLNTPQQQDWLSFRASLPSAGVKSITFKGSLDPVGRTCNDPQVAQQIADAMRAGAANVPDGTVTLQVFCDGFYWFTGACSISSDPVNNLGLEVKPSTLGFCGCAPDPDKYSLKPGISGPPGPLGANWGGIGGPACSRRPNQTLTVEVEFEAGIGLSPLSATNELFTDHTVTATVVSGGVPVEGILVDFEVIDGPNTGETSDPDSGECTPNNDCTTDANGEVSWTYSSGLLGTDTIVATFGDFESNTVEKTWVVIRNIPTLSEWGLIAMAGALGLVGFIVLRRKKVSA